MKDKQLVALGLQIRRLREAKAISQEEVAVRFCYSAEAGFSNCVISLSTLKNFDDRPFLVCLLKPSGVETFLANSTMINRPVTVLKS